MGSIIQNEYWLDLTDSGLGRAKERVFTTYDQMLNAQPPMHKGEIGAVTKDPDSSKDGKYLALITPSTRPQDFKKLRAPFEIRPWFATTAYYERELVVDRSNDNLYYVPKDFTSSSDIDTDIANGNLKSIGGSSDLKADEIVSTSGQTDFTTSFKLKNPVLYRNGVLAPKDTYQIKPDGSGFITLGESKNTRITVIDIADGGGNASTAQHLPREYRFIASQGQDHFKTAETTDLNGRYHISVEGAQQPDNWSHAVGGTVITSEKIDDQNEVIITVIRN